MASLSPWKQAISVSFRWIPIRWTLESQALDLGNDRLIVLESFRRTSNEMKRMSIGKIREISIPIPSLCLRRKTSRVNQKKRGSAARERMRGSVLDSRPARHGMGSMDADPCESYPHRWIGETARAIVLEVRNKDGISRRVPNWDES